MKRHPIACGDLFPVPGVVTMASVAALEGLLPASHRNDPASSKDAAQRALPKAQAMRLACLAALRTCGPKTSHELGAILNCHWSDVARRMTELLAAGKVRRQEKTFANFNGPEILFRREYLTRPTPSGGKACVWFLADKGIADAR